MEGDLLSAERVRAFLATIEHGSFSKAAAALGVTQPSVSQQMKRLENDVGRPLFTRSPQGLATTPDGEAFLLFARAMRSIDEKARFHFSQPRIDGRLRLGVSEEFTRTLAPRVLAIFFRQFPNYLMELTCDPSQRLMADFVAGRHDIVIAHGNAEHGGEPLLRSRLKWIGSPDIFGLIADPIPLLLPSRQDVLHDVTIRALQEAGRSWRVFFQSSSLSVLIDAAEAGIGVCVVGAPIPTGKAADIGDRAGLPRLPDHDVVMLTRTDGASADPGLLALKQVLRTLCTDVAKTQSPATTRS